MNAKDRVGKLYPESAGRYEPCNKRLDVVAR